MGTKPGGERQQEIDWPRVAQLAILRDCQLADMRAKDGKMITSGFAKAVLAQIDHFGRGRECYVSLDRLAAGTNFGRRHVVRALQVLVDASLLIKDRQAVNHYRIVWTELALLVPIERRPIPPSADDAGGARSAPGALSTSAPADPRSAPGASRSALGAPRSAPGTPESVLNGRNGSGPDRKGPFRSELEASPGGMPLDDRPLGGPTAPGFDVRSELIEDHPLLREACQRRVAPLPPGPLVGNVFGVLSAGDLAPHRLVKWGRMQLGVRRPLTHDTEADILLIVAAGLWAQALRPDEVRQSRVAAFVSVVHRGQWRRVCRQLGAARAALDQLQARYPELLTHPEHFGEPLAAPDACPWK